MKFALVDGERREAEKGLSGLCVGCEQSMVAKCGLIKVKHWAHKSQRECDRWWENETEWHRNWKNHFPLEWQEIVHKAEGGEKHIADVETVHRWVIEFQNSFLKSDERLSRDKFYPKLVWVVNGLRLKRDKNQFFSALRMFRSLGPKGFISAIFAVASTEGALLRDWKSTSPVFFDFGDPMRLWCLLPERTGCQRYVLEFSKSTFINLNRVAGTEPDHFANLMSEVEQILWPLSQQIRTAQVLSTATLRTLASRTPQYGAKRYRRW